jgi:hypothetical protein
VFDQNNWNILALVLPVHSALALVFVALAKKKTGEPEVMSAPSPPEDAKAEKSPAPRLSRKKGKPRKAGKVDSSQL